MRCMLICLFIFAQITVYIKAEPNESQTTIIQHTTTEHRSIYVQKLTNYSSLTFDIKYRLYFPSSRCCPRMLFTFFQEDPFFLNFTGEEICFKKESFYDGKAIWYKGRVYLKVTDHTSGCEESHGNIFCNGSRLVPGYLGLPLYVVFGYGCDNIFSLNITFKMEVTQSNETKCLPLPEGHYCQDFYPSVTLPNHYYMSTINEATTAFMGFRGFLPARCFKYLEEAICRMFFTECRNNTPFPVCWEFCMNSTGACREALLESKIEIFCDNFPNYGGTMKCVHKNVTCDPPIPPHQGHVHFSDTFYGSYAKYTCNDNYELLGQDTSQCQLSGLWSPGTPQCIKLQGLSTLSYVIVLVACIVLVIQLTVTLSVKFWYEIQVLWYYTECNYFSTQNGSAVTNAPVYVFHHISSAEYVQSTLTEMLEPRWRLCLPFRDMEYGDFNSTVINNAITTNVCTIALVSRDFIQDEWGRYTIEQAFYFAIKQQCPSLIIVLMEPIATIKQVKDIPPILNAYFRTRTFLYIKETLFWAKLEYNIQRAAERFRPLP